MADESVFFTDKTYGEKGEDILVVNVGANYQINRKKTTHIIKLEILNTTANQSKLYEYYGGDDEKAYGTQLDLIPNIMYQVQF